MDLEKVMLSVSQKAETTLDNGAITVIYDPSQLIEYSWQVSFGGDAICQAGATLNEAFGGASFQLQGAREAAP